MCLRKDLPQMKGKDEKVKLKSLEERLAFYSCLLYFFYLLKEQDTCVFISLVS